jgi:hypothetical protein
MQDYHSLIISIIIWHNRVRDYDLIFKAVFVVQDLISVRTGRWIVVVRARTATTYLQILEVSGACRSQG